RLTGRIDAAVLPLPTPHGGGTDPLPLGALRGWEAAVDVTAARVPTAGGPPLRNLKAHVGVAGGTLNINGLRANLDGGDLDGSVTMGGATVPPALAVDLTLVGAVPDPPVAIGPVTLAGGTMNAAIRVVAHGYSLAAIRATLAGRARVVASGGVLRGLNLPAIRAAVARDEATGSDPVGDAPLLAALAGGATPYATLAADAAIEAGSLTLDGARLAGPDGTIEAAGVAGLAGGGLDLRLALRPATEDGRPGPAIGLQLTGPPDAPRRIPDLAGVLRWLSRG
ncbi:AsmA family protein, partial [Acidisphaera rubrifaciens]|uniref:AsmA family protein n=1 Tax=Acidisphaera rubrifaciens TaxID=50715 RepID=UPI0006627082